MDREIQVFLFGFHRTLQGRKEFEKEIISMNFSARKMASQVLLTVLFPVQHPSNFSLVAQYAAFNQPGSTKGNQCQRFQHQG